jgi:hypothetical protein
MLHPNKNYQLSIINYQLLLVPLQPNSKDYVRKPT